MKELNVRITFKQGILGTLTGDKDVYKNFIASKSPDASTLEDEVANLGEEAVIEKERLFFLNMKGSHLSMTIKLEGSLRVLVVL